MNPKELDFEIEKVQISTSQGDIDIFEDIFAAQSNIYKSFFYQQSPSRIIRYPHLIHQETYDFLKFYLIRNDNKDKFKVEQKQKEIVKYFKEKYEQTIFIEIYRFLKELGIGEEEQKMIIKTIEKNETTKEMMRIYNYFVGNNMGVDLIEEEVFYPNIRIYLQQDIFPNSNPVSTSNCESKQEDEEFKMENVYKMMINCQTSLTKEETVKIIKSLYYKYGKDILINFFDIIQNNFSREDIINIINTQTKRSDKDLGNEKEEPKKVSKEEPKEEPKEEQKEEQKEEPKVDINELTNKNTSYYNYSDDMFTQISKIIQEEIMKNIELRREKDLLKEKFIDLSINEHSTDMELFKFHKKYIKNLTEYQNENIQEHKEEEGKDKEKERKNRKKTKFIYSKEMIERGVILKIPKMLLKSIEEETNEKKAIQKSISYLKSQHITIFSLFKANITFYNKGKKQLFAKINDVILKNITEIDYIFLKSIVEQKSNKNLLAEKQIHAIIKKGKSQQESAKKIKIPKEVETIGEEAFSNCSSLKEVLIEKGIINISKWAFKECKSLEKINIPKSVRTIGGYAFTNCTLLKEVEIEEGIQIIEKNAFSGCISLDRIKIPKSVETIGENAFSNCSSLKEVEIEEGILYIKPKAFIYCASLKRIKIPKSVKNLFKKAFANCSSMKEVEIEEGAHIIDRKAFSGCKSLEKIHIPKSVEIINKNVFSFCYLLKEVEIEEGICVIGENAFSFCKSLERINIPRSIITIEEEAFSNCSSLKKIEIKEGIRSINKNTFSFWVLLKRIKIPRTVQINREGAFSNCSSLKEIEIKEGIHRFSKHSFSGNLLNK